MMKQKAAGILLIVISLGALGFWEFWGRENLAYEQVIVLRQNIPENTEIVRSLLEVKRVENPGDQVLMEKDAAALIGMESAQFIPAGTPLHREFFQDPSLATGGNTGQYILSIPAEWLISFPQTLRRGDEVSFYYGEKQVTSARVAHVRDSSNQEVVSADDARLQATAPASQLEVVVTEAEAVKLAAMAEKGKRFMVLYS
ncbi:MAG: hypothetical protein IKU09_11260 [Firmicutes bacterium]|nr:hypothetical protein [Bacillota bacterium]